MRNVPGLETVQRDFAQKGVKFYYVYKSLAHPGLGGLVQPLTLDERLLHVREADRRFATGWTWLADAQDNQLKHAFGNRNNSEFIIDPHGKIIVARDWSNPTQLRTDLENLVGKPAKNTTVADLGRPPGSSPRSQKIARGILTPLPAPEGARTVKVSAGPSRQPYYIKLRADAGAELLSTGSGLLKLAFHIDPIHHVHWNNLAAPLEFTASAPDGTTVFPEKSTADKIESHESDLDPREFMLDIAGASADTPLLINVSYFPCHDTEGWCKAVTQTFNVVLKPDPDAGRPSAQRGGRGRQSSDRGAPPPAEILRSQDRDSDGKISRSEARGPLVGRFTNIDTNTDGFLTLGELAAMRRP